MKIALSVLALLASAPAFADGFICQSTDGSLNVKIYDHTSAVAGTRNASVMVLSDAQATGSKTIARFTDTEGTLQSTSESYVGKADFRFHDQNQDATLLGASYADVATVAVMVDYDFSRPVSRGDAVPGTINLSMRDSSPDVTAELSCTRYLKN